MGIINKLIYHLDLFKSPFTFLFNSKVKISSKFSSLLSIGISIFLISYFFQSDLFQKKRPNSSTQTISSPSRPRLDFNYDNMGLAFALMDSENLYYYDNSYFTYEVKNLIYASSGELLEQDVKELQPCNATDFISHGNAYNDLALEKAFCPTTGNLTLEGYWNEKIVKYSYIQLSLCKNKTSNFTCRTPQEIFDYFQDKYFTIFYSDNSIDVNNYENPMKKTYKTSFFMMDYTISKKITMNFKKVYFINDDGLIFSNEISTESFMFGNIEMDYLSNNLEYIGIITLYSSSDIYVVTRNYQKLQEAIANLGGLANALLLLGYCITFLEKEYIVFNKIMNKIYTFSEDNKNLHCQKNIKALKTIVLKNVDNDNNQKKNTDYKYSETNKRINSQISLNLFEKIYSPAKNQRKSSVRNSIEKRYSPTRNQRKLSERNSIIMETSLYKNCEKYPKITFICPKNLPKDSFYLDHFSETDLKNENPEKNKNKRVTLASSFKTKFKSLITNNKDNKTKNSLSFCEFLKIKLKLPFIKLTKKDKLYKEAFRQYKKKIDLVDVIHKIHDIDKLKVILFNPEQCKLFNLLAKPVISDKTIRNNQRKSQLSGNVKMAMCLENLNEDLGLEKLENYYLKMKAEGKEASKIDQRLVSMIDENRNL